MLLVYVLFLILGVAMLIAGLGFFASFIVVMIIPSHLSWWMFILMCFLSAVSTVIGFLMIIHYFPLVLTA